MVIAHELGHWAGSHVLILLGTSLLQTAFTLSIFILFLNNPSLLSAFGFSSSTTLSHTLISLFLAANLFSPLSAVLQLAMNSVTRALEYNADNFAVKLGEEYAQNLKGALVRIHEDNLVRFSFFVFRFCFCFSFRFRFYSRIFILTTSIIHPNDKIAK